VKSGTGRGIYPAVVLCLVTCFFIKFIHRFEKLFTAGGGELSSALLAIG
jgi:hypothetical protein